jgi:hypothetical protein
MKFINALLLAAIAFGMLSSPVFATLDQDGSRFLEELNERDFDSLRDFINTKRTIDVAEKASNLTISGDVRTEWRHLDESCNGNRIRGHDRFDPHHHLPISRNDFDIEFNLRFDYVCDRAWAVAHLQFDNSAGVDDNGHPCEFKDNDKPKHKRKHHGKKSKCKDKDRDCLCGKDRHCGDKSSDHLCKADPKGYHGSGFCDDLCLKKAYWGYNICCDGASRLDIEVGRRNLYNAFDSKIQFLSRFDGILLSYSTCFECMADFYVKGAAFVVDERVNHFAYAAEIGLINICDIGLDFKYSIIDWLKNGKNRCCERDPKGFKFIISQWTLCYRFNPDWLCNKTTRVYGAFLWNHNGKRHICKRDHCKADQSEGPHHSHSKNENLGWYLGFTVGEVVQENDWSLDVQYQVVQAFAIPDNDLSGIGRGNVLKESITTCAHRGNTNFSGWRIEGLYALTDNLTIDSILEWSRHFDKSIGGRHRYSKFEVEAIYAF